MSDLAAALQIAIKVHAAQRDKQGEPYLLHVLRVVEAVSSERAKVLAALHDVWEDGARTTVDPEEVFEQDGMFIANSLEVLTRSEGETYAEYIECIRAGHSSTWAVEVREVKLADLRDNLKRIPLSPDDPRYPTTFWTAEYTKADADRDWQREWASLKVRYEKAIEALT